MWNLKYDTNELIFETETDSQAQKTDLWLPTGRGVGEFRVSRCKLLRIDSVSNKAPVYCTGNYGQRPVINYDGKKYEKECVYN